MLPKQTWIYNKESNSFLPLTTKPESGDVIISYNPSTHHNCEPCVVIESWIDENKQICFTSKPIDKL